MAAASNVAAPESSGGDAAAADETATVDGPASPKRRDAMVHEAATVERGREVEAPRGAPPAVAEPGEARRSEESEVRPRSPAPYPRCNHPRPSVGRVVDELVRLTESAGRHVGVRVSIRHPDPTILGGVDPLPGRSGLGGWSLSLGWRGRKSLRWCRGRLRWLRAELACPDSRLGGDRQYRCRTILCRPGRRGRKEQRPGQEEGLEESSHGLTPASVEQPACQRGRGLATMPADGLA